MTARNPDIAFTRNPISFTDTSQESALRSFFVKVDGKSVYSGRYIVPAVVDVAEIAEAAVPPIPSPEGTPVDESGVFLQLEDAEEFGKRRVKVTNPYGASMMPDFYALPGGVSPQNYRRLKELDTDIFAARLLDKRHNFFLTTRTHRWRIVMDEYEVYPLVMVNLNDEEDAEIEIEAVGTNYKFTAGVILRGIYAIDIAAARRKIADDEGYLASAFNIYYDGFLACQIVIRHTPPERNLTMVKFRNSLGVNELLHLSGKKECAAVPQETDQTTKRYDGTTGRYVDIRQRMAAAKSFSIDTGCKTEEELAFILDMATSDEVYLQQRTGWVKVIPSIEKTNLQTPQMEPQSVTVSFSIADEYDCQTPDIKDLDDFERPKIFSEQHTDEFN